MRGIFTRRCWWAAVAIAVVAASTAPGCNLAPANRCLGDPGGAVPTAAELCAHLASLRCYVGPRPTYLDSGPDGGVLELDTGPTGGSIVEVHARECALGHSEWQASLAPSSFAEVTRCVMAATNCAEVEGCQRACALFEGDGGDGLDAPMSIDAPLDAATADAPIESDAPLSDTVEFDTVELDTATPDAP